MKEIQGVIYGLSCTCHPEAGVRYVGQTQQKLQRRFNGHLQDARGALEGRRPHDYAVYRWIRRHNYLIDVRVLETCTSIDALNEAEIRWIAELGTFGNGQGLNQCEGGKGQIGRKASAETRRKMSEAHRGKSRDAGFAEKMSNIVRTARATDETKAKYQSFFATRGGPAAKVSADDVREIRGIRAETGRTYRDIADQFGLTPNAVSHMCRRLTWKHVI